MSEGLQFEYDVRPNFLMSHGLQYEYDVLVF